MTQETKKTGVKRREFLKVLGASSATLAITACDEPTGKLIPYLVSPDPDGARRVDLLCHDLPRMLGGVRVIAETRDGRAIKLEGNPDHPAQPRRVVRAGQSALQGLYNPDRFRAPMVNEGGTWKTISWDDAITRLNTAVAGARRRINPVVPSS
jgi:molybdopterin-containing oxidoreductase family iron-sulfur binding subunit